MVGEGVIGQHAQALRAPDGFGPLGHQHDRVGIIADHPRGGEYLPRADEVQLLGAVEDQQSVRCHISSLVDRNLFR